MGRLFTLLAMTCAAFASIVFVLNDQVVAAGVWLCAAWLAGLYGQGES